MRTFAMYVPLHRMHVNGTAAKHTNYTTTAEEGSALWYAANHKLSYGMLWHALLQGHCALHHF